MDEIYDNAGVIPFQTWLDITQSPDKAAYVAWIASNRLDDELPGEEALRVFHALASTLPHAKFFLRNTVGRIDGFGFDTEQDQVELEYRYNRRPIWIVTPKGRYKTPPEQTRFHDHQTILFWRHPTSPSLDNLITFVPYVPDAMLLAIAMSPFEDIVDAYQYSQQAFLITQTLNAYKWQPGVFEGEEFVYLGVEESNNSRITADIAILRSNRPAPVGKIVGRYKIVPLDQVTPLT